MPKETWIYLIKDNHTGFFKIGNSIKPFERLSELRRQTTKLPIPFSFELVEAWRGEQTDETNLHKQFRKHRVHGEWFKLDKDALDDLSAYFYRYTRLSTRTSDYEVS